MVEACLDNNAEVFASADRVLSRSGARRAEIAAHITAAASIDLLARSEIGTYFGGLAAPGADFAAVIDCWRRAVHAHHIHFRLSANPALLPRTRPIKIGV